MNLKIDISDENKLNDAAEKLISFANKHTLFLFDAQMGAGKTTFIKALCKHLGVTIATSSPTYSIVNHYETENKTPIFHFDLYRLTSTEELFDLGFEDYLKPKQYVFIEWPKLALPFIDTYVDVTIELIDKNRYLCAQIKN